MRRVGPLEDCRYVAVSPDGQWLATGNHDVTGAQVWRIRDGERVAELPVQGVERDRRVPARRVLHARPVPVPVVRERE